MLDAAMLAVQMFVKLLYRTSQLPTKEPPVPFLLFCLVFSPKPFQNAWKKQRLSKLHWVRPAHHASFTGH